MFDSSSKAPTSASALVCAALLAGSAMVQAEPGLNSAPGAAATAGAGATPGAADSAPAAAAAAVQPGDTQSSASRPRTTSSAPKRILVAQAQVAATTSAPPADAGAAAADSTGELQEVVVTGTRQTGIEAVQSPAPIQIVGSTALQQTASIPNLMNTLAQAVPSFTTQVTGGDMGGLTLQAKLDGLSPNEVLVLVDGKRRNTTANLSVDGGNFQGGAGVDLSLIPQDAIDHIEVLQDGAAAQYGSDAIAGVINIILKKNTGGYITASDGGYFDGGGKGGNVAATYGFQIADDGYLDLTGQIINHGHSYRGFPDLRSVVNDCPSTQDICSSPNSNEVDVANWPYVNLIEGDGEQHLKLLAANGGYDFSDAVQFYTTTTFADKDANTYENYRLPDRVSYTDATTGETIYPFPDGFNPLEAIQEVDYQETGGFKGVFDNWHWDLSSGLGGDHINVYTLDSVNATEVSYYEDATEPLDEQESPNLINFYDGTLTTTQWTNNLDFDRDFDVGMAGPLNVAFGAEYRRETFGIAAGVPASWELGGAQSFAGWAPTNAGEWARENEAGYVDFALKPIDPLRIDIAGRYEHYSDFGSATVGKLTARYDVSPEFALRGTFNNGFRAPTLAEEHYSSTNVGPTSVYVQMAPDSPAAKLLGLGNGLQPEKSVNFSFGFVWRPVPRLNVTLDAYQITITNRIVGSGSIVGTLNGVEENPLVTEAIGAAGYNLGNGLLDTGINIFTNGIDTRTRGAQLTLDYPVNYGAAGNVDYNVGWSWNNTEVTAIYPNPPALGATQLFDPGAISDLTTANPLWIMNIGAVWNIGNFTVNVLEKLYGPTSTWGSDGGDNPTGNQEWFLSSEGVTPLTNITLAYQLTKHLVVSGGAQNAFNRYPSLENPTLISRTINPYYVQHDGNTGIDLYGPAPFGFDGGYYFVNGKYTF